MRIEIECFLMPGAYINLQLSLDLSMHLINITYTYYTVHSTIHILHKTNVLVLITHASNNTCVIMMMS